jgi:signal transduction histidine kinase
VSRIESKSLVLSREVFDLGKKVEEAIADVQTLIPSEHAPIRYAPSKLPVLKVNADASKISRVIINLLRNAVKFTAESKDSGGGTIELELDVNIKSKEALISIRDSGPGIDPFILPRLFTKFSSGAQQGGTGLGLYIAKAIVEAHGGRIWGENNKEGRGATFGFALPLDEASLKSFEYAS